MFNKSEKEERNYLEQIKERLNNTLEQIDRNVDNFVKDLKEQKAYLAEHKAGMDHAEKVAVHQSVTQSALTGEAAVERKKRLQKLMQSPWFGRFDFREKDKEQSKPLYIGVHAYYDEEQKENLIYDWRAPISTMFYDYELGEAEYEAPAGKIKGEITCKRQFRIRLGKMEYMLESSLNIHDEILQKELGKASDDKMKHIVATIQRDQNAIIRNETSHELIIQGVAGSGKTSIALHRIAFLLYRFKTTISSKDILILSPNKVFADYISNVLPELGEEKIPEMGIEELANEILQEKYRFQTFFEQVSELLEKKEQDFQERIQFKASFEFLNKLNEYLTFVENNYFEPHTIVVKRYPIPADYLLEKFKNLHRIPLFNRFNEIASLIERDLHFYNGYEINAKERNELRKNIKNMFKITNLRELYKDFYNWLEKPELFKYAKGTKYEYADLYPLVHLKIKTEGIRPYEKVKHLLVDEMQDYTPVQYAVLARLFPCKKTILGDANQSVNPFSSSTSEIISKTFPGAQCMLLNKSYRSTWEIAQFAQSIQPNSDLEVIERHGEKPAVVACSSNSSQTAEIKKIISNFDQSGHNSMGIICKTRKQAQKLFESINKDVPKIKLLHEDSQSFSNGIVITSAHMSKGLEFDQVIVPGTDASNFNSLVDRGLLYISCTRAMHNLYVLYVKEKSEFLNGTH